MLKITLKNYISRVRLFVLLTAMTPPLGLIITPPARAQEAPVAPVPSNKQQMRPLSTILASMTRASGIDVVADGTVASTPVPLPSEAVTPENLERQIATLVAALPQGTTWAKLYLPPPAGGRGYDGNIVADYAKAQSRLVGPVGGETPAGIVEIFGQRIPSDKAQAHIAALNLKPVYLITNPNSTSGFGLNGDPSKWSSLTPEQQKKFAQDTAAQLANMDPASRNALMQQNFMIFGQLMQQLPADQRTGLFQGMMGGAPISIRVAPAQGSPQVIQGDAVIIARPNPQ